MSRISIDVTNAQHARLKALAALQGLSIKDFVLTRTLGPQAEDADLAELQALLDRRIARTVAEGPSTKSVTELFRASRTPRQRRRDA